MGGVVVEGGKFPWDNGQFHEMIEPSRANHGVSFYETFGGVLSPLNAWLLLQGADMLRLGVGIEDVDDTLWDIGQALERAPRLRPSVLRRRRVACGCAKALPAAPPLYGGCQPQDMHRHIPQRRQQ